MKKRKKLYQDLPETPGVYLMKDARGKLLYVGKAGNLKRRVSSYFLRPHDARIEGLVARIARIDHKDTDSALEALILESALIKRHQPPFNVREKDDKSFLYVGITKEEFPRVLLLRGKELNVEGGAPPLRARFGPFVSASNLKEALRIMRRIFPWNTHEPEKVGAMRRPCFDHQIGLCPGTCIGAVTKGEYMRTVRNIALFLSGQKGRVAAGLERDMKSASGRLEFEKAERIKRQLFALRHVQDTALIGDGEIADRGLGTERSAKRIEGYDISNISGTDPVGSMVVFSGDRPAKGEYRKFIIRSVAGSNDVGMLREMLDRRFSRAADEKGWARPDLVLVDGGKGQVNAAREVLAGKGIAIPVLGIAKGPERKRNDIVGTRPEWVSARTLERVRDEAHRFAITFHKRRRSATFIGKGSRKG